MITVGLVSPSSGTAWLGGHYITQHLFVAAALAARPGEISFRDVWWGAAVEEDPFAEVRAHLDEPAVVRLPSALPARAVRAARRALTRVKDDGDLYRAAGIDVLFPVRLTDEPGVPFVFYLPDFQYRYLHHLHDERGFRYFDDYNRQEAARARLVYVSSQSVLRDLEQFMPELRPKTRMIFPCTIPTETWWARDPADVARQYRLPERYFVISNMVAAHKNHRSIAEALRVLRDRGIEVHVICTGKTSDYRDPAFFPALQKEIADVNMRFLDVVPRADQIAILRGAVAAIQPSEFEGWGAAVADAKALGKPILASDLPIHHEHVAPRTTYVSPHHVEGWAAAIEDALAAYAPGPDLEAEEEAAARTSREVQQIGRQAIELFREAGGAPRLSLPR